MTSTYFGDIYEEASTGTVGIPESTYDVEVSEARPKADSNLIFLTLKVLNGPAAGKATDVSLYFPGEGASRGARFYFHKKVGGFIGDPQVKEAFQRADSAPTLDVALQIIGDALKGKRVTAEIGLQGADAGQYAGSNELRATRPLEGAAPAASSAPAPAASVPAQAAPAEPEQNFADTVSVPTDAPF